MGMHEPVPDRSLHEQFPRILAAACAGGEWAWRELYEAIAPQLTRYLRARGVPEPDDVVGETFVKVVRYIDGFEGDEAAFRTWVFTIGRNLVVDDLRKRARRPVDVATDDQLAAAAPKGDTEDDAMGDLSVAHVEEILQHLSVDQRDVLLLRILGGLTIPEIAQVVGKKEGAVKMLQARGLAAIRAKISLGSVTL
jgi:RNA polymerase sigma-70 factor (ECF subfamily)